MKQIKHEVPSGFRRKLAIHLKVGEFLYRHGLLRKVFFRLGASILSIMDDYNRHCRKIGFFEKTAPSQNNTLLYGNISRFSDVLTTLNYASEIHDPSFGESSVGESFRLYEEQVKLLTVFFKNNKNVSKFLNFGVSYAYVDSKLASEFNSVDFFGVDLSKYNKSLNEVEFSKFGNMKFVNGDIIDFMDSTNFDGGCLFHSRICCLLPKTFIERLYKKAFDAGFNYIIGFEQFGLSTETLEPFVFSEDDTESIYWRDYMHVHNYTGIAVKSGYEIEQSFVFETGHSNPDYRVLCFVAKRRPM